MSREKIFILIPEKALIDNLLFTKAELTEFDKSS